MSSSSRDTWPDSVSSAGDRLIFTFCTVRRSSGWSVRKAQIRRICKSPMAAICPCFSARGMNTSGDTGPRAGWCRRLRASRETYDPREMEYTGW